MVQTVLFGFGLLSRLDLEQELIQVGFNLIVLPTHLHREQDLEIAIPQRKYDFGRFVVIKEIAASGKHGGIIIRLAKGQYANIAKFLTQSTSQLIKLRIFYLVSIVLAFNYDRRTEEVVIFS